MRCGNGWRNKMFVEISNVIVNSDNILYVKDYTPHELEDKTNFQSTIVLVGGHEIHVVCHRDDMGEYLHLGQSPEADALDKIYGVLCNMYEAMP